MEDLAHIFFARCLEASAETSCETQTPCCCCRRSRRRRRRRGRRRRRRRRRGGCCCYCVLSNQPHQCKQTNNICLMSSTTSRIKNKQTQTQPTNLPAR